MVEEVSSVVMLVVILLVIFSALVGWRIGYYQGQQSRYGDDFNAYNTRDGMSKRSMRRNHKPY